MVCSLSWYAEVILLWCFCQSEGLVVGCADRRWCLCTASGHRLHGDVWLLSVLPLAALPLACLLHHLILVFYTCARITQLREELDRMHTANSGARFPQRCCFRIASVFVICKSSYIWILGFQKLHQKGSGKNMYVHHNPNSSFLRTFFVNCDYRSLSTKKTVKLLIIRQRTWHLKLNVPIGWELNLLYN